MPDYYYADDKLPTTTHDEEPRPRSRVRRLLRWAVLAAVVAQGLLVLNPGAGAAVSDVVQRGCHSLASAGHAAAGHTYSLVPPLLKDDKLCAQESALQPEDELYKKLGYAFGTPEFRQRAVDLHSGAVQIPTESYDKMDEVGVDPRWEAFGPFHEYLLKSFPQVHATLEQTKVNTYGLIYVWKGSDSSLKPLLLMAHQDVVPVDPKTVDEWTHPPYSGFYDGERIWGRGSSDDKSGLMGIMIAIETLIEQGFTPKRSVVLSFGFDEETSGLHGAQELAKALKATYGEKAFAMIVDEGGGFDQRYGGVFAIPGIAEKGYLDVRVAVSAPGGHSSIPPPHTSIGMLSHMLVKYESNPYEVHLKRGTPMFSTLQCVGAHAPSLPHKLKKAIAHAGKSDHALKHVEKIMFKDPAILALTGTTQAIDLINGGVKTNALPESAYAVVNHRIDTASSVKDVMKHDTKLLKPFAEKFNLSLTAFGTRLTEADKPTYGILELSDAWGTALEPAPVTPVDGAPYKLLSGTIKAVYAAHRGGQDVKEQEITVAPGIMSGNTDTRYYWALSDHIFRYNHHNAIGGKALGGVHTVNENIRVDGFLEQIRFFNTLILNVNEAEL